MSYKEIAIMLLKTEECIRELFDISFFRLEQINPITMGCVFSWMRSDERIYYGFSYNEKLELINISRRNKDNEEN